MQQNIKKIIIIKLFLKLNLIFFLTNNILSFLLLIII